jgi:hypothetical protein
MHDRCGFDAAPLVSLYDDARMEADKFKWLESELRRHDVGGWGHQEWTRRHWHDFLRGKRIEHLFGLRCYREFEPHTFGVLAEWALNHRAAIDFIVDHFLRKRWENIHFFWIGDGSGCSRDVMLQLLDLIGINALRHWEPPEWLR